MAFADITPALRRSYQPRLGQPKKGMNCNFSWPELDKPLVCMLVCTYVQGYNRWNVCWHVYMSRAIAVGMYVNMYICAGL